MTAEPAILTEMRWLCEASRARRPRGIAQWLVEEIAVPSGPLKGRPYSLDSQPYQRLLFEEIDSGRWMSIVLLGPSQSGKTFVLVAIVLHAALELRENVIVGVPDLNLAEFKWSQDFLPIIAGSRYVDELPVVGDGSRGGKVKSIVFRGGGSITFLSGGTGDAGRAGYTAPIIGITEADQLDEPGGTSREGTKIDQLRARSRAFEAAGRRRLFAESTVTIETGFVWRTWQQTTRSKIVMPCPHCGEFVHPTRLHLVGWQDATTKREARERGALSCESCGATWTEDERRVAMRASRLLHGGQTIDRDGDVAGDPPQTDTLAFRWTSADNSFALMGALAAEEWEAARRPDADDADTTIRQQVWTTPPEARRKSVSTVVEDEIARRSTSEPRRVCPLRSELMTAGIDVGKRRIHWVLVAWSSDASGHVVDYGEAPVASDAQAEERAILDALRRVRDDILPRSLRSVDGLEIGLRRALVDASYQTTTVYDFARECDPAVWLPVMGFGAGEEGRSYKAPSPDKRDVVSVGDGWHVHLQRAGASVNRLGNLDADHWKAYVHARLTTPTSEPGAMTLFRGTSLEHMAFARHMTAETKVEEFKPGRGLVVSWRQERPDNHFFDCMYYAAAAAHMAGVRIVLARKATKPTRVVEGYARRDGEDGRGGRAWRIGR